MNYKELNKYEKLQKVIECNPRGNQRIYYAKYLKALWLNNTLVIEDFEKFGSTPRHFISNYICYQRGLLFGFDTIRLSPSGWLNNALFTEIEVIQFKGRNEKCSNNYVKIGKGLNGKWTYSITYGYGFAGGGSGLSVWGDIFNTKKQALILGLEKIVTIHQEAKIRLKNDTCGNFRKNYSEYIVSMVKNKLDELTGKKLIQLELF